MLAFWRRWRERKRKSIFRYWDGQRNRCIDPLVAARRLSGHPHFDWERDPELIDLAELDEGAAAEADAAHARTAAAVRDAFEVPATDSNGNGLTESECVLLLIDFVAYLNALKKNGNPPPTSPQCTESEQSERPERTGAPAADGSAGPSAGPVDPATESATNAQSDCG